MGRRKNRNQVKFEADLTIEKLNERGYGVSHFEGKEVQILNALPGEKVKAQIFKKRKSIYLAEVAEILEKSSYRLSHKEEHYLSCSPWQIIPLDKENEFKKELIKEFYQHVNVEIPVFEVISDEREYGYRNKVEFSFYGHEDNHVTLAFHTRESGFHKIPADSCVLMPESVNKVANGIVNLINEYKISARQLKGLLIRYSFSEKKVIAELFVKDPNILKPFQSENFDEVIWKKLTDQSAELKSFFVINSDFRSPAFVETEILLRIGEADLTEDINGIKLRYPYNGFFQVNPPVFELAIMDMIDYVKKENFKDLIVADIYAGVGSIGLCLASYFKQVIGVEITPSAKEYALINKNFNKIDNFEFYSGLAEKEGLEYVKSDVLVLDPPRVGIHQKVVRQIIEDKPKYIIYLSCNPKTQAENISEFKDLYNIEFFKAYNFYPHTPHVESLCILRRK